MSKLKVAAAAVVSLSAAGIASAEFPFTLTLTPDRTIIDINDPLTHTVTVTASASAVGGIGAVSGFSGVSIVQDGPAGSGVFAVTVLEPFDALAIGSGTMGDDITGLAGGQAAFPPMIPIDPRLDLFEFTFTDLDLTERFIDITVSGFGGYFTSPEGASLVPFEAFAGAMLRLQVIPAPGVAPILMAAGFMLHRKRRRDG